MKRKRDHPVLSQIFELTKSSGFRIYGRAVVEKGG
jgi:hypothetical protein